MLSSDQIAELRDRHRLWGDEMLPNYMFEAAVLAALSDEDAKDYEVTDLLGEKAISLLLQQGERQLKYETTGGMRVIESTNAGPREIDISHLAGQYRKLFKQWVRRGWIEFDGGYSVKRLK